MTRISSLDEGYQAGDLSLYPDALDDKETLYEASNNAETVLQQSLSYNGRNIIVQDASKFPANGLVRLGQKGQAGELVYYGKRSDTVLSDLIRGFAGSKQNVWSAQTTYVSSSVMAEHHNALKDALINIENHLGTAAFPEPESLNGILKGLEVKHLAPKPLFRAYPLKGSPALSVRFQNFSGGDAIRFMWDFGDGSTSIERNPIHIYQQEGTYTVKLNIITSTGAQGVSVKSNYIKVSHEDKTPFFYVEPDAPALPNYSMETAAATGNGAVAQMFHFVDQSDGNIIERYWVFDDGEKEKQTDADVHSTTHTYTKPGKYSPSLLLVFATQRFKRVFLSRDIIVV